MHCAGWRVYPNIHCAGGGYPSKHCLPGGVCPGVSAWGCLRGGVSAGGVFPGEGVCPPRGGGVSAQGRGVFVQGEMSAWGMSAQGGLSALGGVCPGGGVFPLNRMTDRQVLKHYLAATSLWTVTIIFIHCQIYYHTLLKNMTIG